MLGNITKENAGIKMISKEIQFPLDTTHRFKHLKTLDEGTNIYSFNYSLALGLIVNDPQVLVIPACLFHMFNPISVPDLKKVQVGDLIQVTVDPNDPLYKAWEGPEDQILDENYSKIFAVESKELDLEGLEVIVALPSV